MKARALDLAVAPSVPRHLRPSGPVRLHDDRSKVPDRTRPLVRNRRPTPLVWRGSVSGRSYLVGVPFAGVLRRRACLWLWRLHCAAYVSVCSALATVRVFAGADRLPHEGCMALGRRSEPRNRYGMALASTALLRQGTELSNRRMKLTKRAGWAAFALCSSQWPQVDVCMVVPRARGATSPSRRPPAAVQHRVAEPPGCR